VKLSAFRKLILHFLKKGGHMIVRLTYLEFLPGKVEEARRIYRDEIVPVVRQQKGNLECKVA
jgi:hypothetical protein